VAADADSTSAALRGWPREAPPAWAGGGEGGWGNRDVGIGRGQSGTAGRR
jgi:hypothetical protein